MNPAVLPRPLAKAQPTLLGIPSELRQRIYKFVFADIHIVEDVDHETGARRFTPCPAHPLGILRTNRQVHAEAGSVAYLCDATLYTNVFFFRIPRGPMPVAVAGIVTCVRTHLPMTFAASCLRETPPSSFQKHHRDLQVIEFVKHARPEDELCLFRDEAASTVLDAIARDSEGYKPVVLHHLFRTLDDDVLFFLLKELRDTGLTLKFPCVFMQSEAQPKFTAHAMLLWNTHGVRVTELEDRRVEESP